MIVRCRYSPPMMMMPIAIATIDDSADGEDLVDVLRAARGGGAVRAGELDVGDDAGERQGDGDRRGDPQRGWCGA